MGLTVTPYQIHYALVLYLILIKTQMEVAVLQRHNKKQIKIVEYKSEGILPSLFFVFTLIPNEGKDI